MDIKKRPEPLTTFIFEHNWNEIQLYDDQTETNIQFFMRSKLIQSWNIGDLLFALDTE